MMGDVQNKNTENDARDRGNPVRTAKEKHVECIEPIPDATPDHNKADRDTHITS